MIFRREFGCARSRAASLSLGMGAFLVALFVLPCRIVWAENEQLLDAVLRSLNTQIQQRVVYNSSYRRIPYPMGDVPASQGVCSDVVIRAYRAGGVDLQKLVHEDMQKSFSKYPSLWGLTKPDSNIDHRRVPNLAVFFGRFGTALAASTVASDYQAGDIVVWDIGARPADSLLGYFQLRRSIPHIGIVTKDDSLDGKRKMIVHNIGAGPKKEDVLFAYRITGHYRYLP